MAAVMAITRNAIVQAITLTKLIILTTLMVQRHCSVVAFARIALISMDSPTCTRSRPNPANDVGTNFNGATLYITS